MIDTLVVAVFWGGLFWAMYAYVVFPFLASVLSRRKRSHVPHRESGWTPIVTVIIPAYNEARSIDARIRNILQGRYPAARLDVLVVSDASTDGTNEIVRRFADAGVRLLVQETRRGKTDGLNRAMALARGELVLFTDANASYLPDTIQRIVGRFVDARVGMVTGYTRYRMNGDGNISEATNLYTSLERLIKRAESAWGCCVGADGAVFAIRRALYRPLREDDINDFVIPLRVIEQGYGCVLAEEAYCTELPGDTLESEFRRQSRITNRTLRALFRNAHLLNPIRFPAFAFFLWSHKLVRFLVPPLLTLSALSLLVLFPRGGFYGLGAVAGGLVVLVTGLFRSAGATAQWLPGARYVRLVDVFVTINVAVLHGWWKFAAGRVEITWQHDRSPA